MYQLKYLISNVNMEIKKLCPDVLSKLRSTYTINTVTQCVIELVLNSLDAKSTAIAVRINLVTFRIQVVDNGEGILEENLSQVGRRYFTNKCKTLEQLEKHIKYYGFRGEALASIIESSKSVNITSRHASSSETYSKTCGKHTNKGVTQVRDRPSVGTTVTVEGFFYNLPVRRKRLISELELEEIKNSMESLMIMNPEVSFTIRNDVTSELLLNTQKNKDILSSFKYLHPEVGDDFCFMKISKGKLSVDALLFKELSDNMRLQYLFVNKRPICSPKIQKLVCKMYYKFHKISKKKSVEFVNKYPVFVINVKCPYSQLDILLNPTKTMVEFENWNVVQRCIEKLITSFFGDVEQPQNNNEPVLPLENSKKHSGVSAIAGAFRSYGYKRKNSENEAKTPEKAIKLADEDVAEERQLGGNISDDAIEDSLWLKMTQDKKTICPKAVQEKTKAKKSPKRDVAQKLDVQRVEDIPDTESCHISDSSPSAIAKPKIKIKKPLPVTVFQKKKQANKNSEASKLARKQTLHLEKPMATRQDDAKSTLSKFTDDQTKGKSLIMNMFLKSTQIYSSDENMGEINASQETVYEEESNFLMENNFQTKVNGVSNAMSVSVNVKSTKKIRQAKNAGQKASKCVQTSFEDNRMISKGLQTTFNLHRKKKKHDSIFPDSTVKDNYTVVLSDRTSGGHFKFAPKNKGCEEKPGFEKLFIGKKCICNCHEDTSKYFNFETERCDEFGVDFPQSDKFNKLNLNLGSACQKKTSKYCKNTNHIEPDRAFAGHIETENRFRNARVYERSPYFTSNRKNKLQTFNVPDNYINGISYNPYYEPYFHPQYQYLPKPQYRHPMDFQYQYGIHNNPYINQNPVLPQYPEPNKFCDDLPPNCSPQSPQDNIPNLDCSFMVNEDDRNEKTLRTNDWTIGSFGQFKPAHLSTQQNDNDKVRDRTDLVFSQSFEKHFNPNIEPLRNLLSVSEERNRDNASEKFCPAPNPTEKVDVETRNDENDVNPTLQARTSPNTHNSSILNTQQRLEKEWETERSVLAKEFMEWDSQFTDAAKEENFKKSDKDEITEDWIKKFNDFGSSYYINKRTGFTTYCTPKPAGEQFKIAERLDFVPKGMSPILMEIKEVDRSLSQNGKDKLLEYIMETYKNELIYIKWQHYLKDVDPSTFFENMYKEKLKMFEDSIPNISIGKKNLTDVVSFSNTLFKNIEVIGQVDKKFIAVLDRESNLLILFDQHAVHERIRLEKLLKIYKEAKSELAEKLLFFIP
ncbi:uncharacterized protein [Leptinotarsa decemlineata]|uniref:uncharacterized protein n=1 Tax=Leptinotarsa decemlineata TaxID=7539 RepID=UPI003D30A0AD